MKTYFHLQYLFANRKLKELGLHPAVGYVIGALGFALLGILIYKKTSYAPYLFVLLGLSILFTETNTNKIEFLELTFGKQKMQTIRLTENLILASPVVLILCIYQDFLFGFTFLIIALIFSLFKPKRALFKSLPTPFGRHPFEFTVGFRKVFLLFIGTYLLTLLAIIYSNLNLGLFAILLVFLVLTSFYSQPENEYYVWTFAFTPDSFLKYKLKIATIYSFILAIPIIASLILYFREDALLIAFTHLFGLSLLFAVILGKYVKYPNEMDIIIGLGITFSLLLPPLLLFLLPYFYIKAKQNLKHILK